MASAILSIYDALAAVTVSDGTNSIAARDVDLQPNSLTTADAPLRILTVIDPRGGQQQARSDTSWGAAAGSGLYRITWIIYDVLYHTPLAQGRGIRDVNVALLTYMGNYYAMLAATVALPADAALASCTMQPSVLEYPLGSGHTWYAVRGMLTIQEDVCP